MEEPGSSGESRKDRHLSVNRVITTTGIILVLASVAIAGIFPLTFVIIALAIAVFSIGCALLWFGVIHPAVLTGEERIRKIEREIDQVQKRVSRRKK